MLRKNRAGLVVYFQPAMIAIFIVMSVLAKIYTDYSIFYLKSLEAGEISRADILIYNQRIMQRNYIGYILLLLLFTMAIRNDFLCCNILQHKKRTSIWNYQVIKLSVLGIITAFIYSVASIFLVTIICKEKINWLSVNSIFTLVTGEIACISYVEVVAAYVVTNILMAEIVMLIGLLLYWLTNNIAIAWVSVLSLYVVDIYVINRLFKLVRIDYKSWQEGSVGIYMAAAAVICAVLYAIGRCAANKKEFLQKRYR